MGGVGNLLTVALIGLATTSSTMVGASISLYLSLSKRVLAGILAFAAGALISALTLEIAYNGAQEVHHHGFSATAAWAFVGGGFAVGAIVYFSLSLYLEKRGAAVRYQTQFREYAIERKQNEAKELLGLLARCDLLRHLPPEDMAGIVPFVRTRHLKAGETLFRAGDPGDALFIVAQGAVAVVEDASVDGRVSEHVIAELHEGHAFGEMALLSGGPRTATIRAVGETELLAIGKEDFERLVTADHKLASAVQHLSHARAISNLSAGGTNPATWAKVASNSLDHVSRSEANKMLHEAGHGAGTAIIFSNLLDSVPGCFVIGAKFQGMATLSASVMLGMFLGGLSESAVSATMLTKAGYRPRAIYGMWSTVLVAGIIAAVAGRLLIGNHESLVAVFVEALAGGAVLAVVAHAMIPEAIHDGGSLIVLPIVGGFLAALYLALTAALH